MPTVALIPYTVCVTCVASMQDTAYFLFKVNLAQLCCVALSPQRTRLASSIILEGSLVVYRLLLWALFRPIPMRLYVGALDFMQEFEV